MNNLQISNIIRMTVILFFFWANIIPKNDF